MRRATSSPGAPASPPASCQASAPALGKASTLSGETQLWEAYDRWQTLALAEGEAICARDWTRLAACQAGLRELQSQITQDLARVRRAWGRLGSELAARESPFRKRVAELLEIERRNSTLLEEARRLAVAQLAQVHQTARTLRRIRSSYAPARPPCWTSFS